MSETSQTAVTRQPVRAAAAAFAGTTIEWYDFFVYSTASALVFPQLFFPGSDPTVGLLASFATFAVGFFARPFGGFLFGHLGDRFGRKRALIATLLLMGTATTAIGFLPTYGQIGIWAPTLLILCRVLQGVSVGGEWGGAVLMAGEHAPKARRTWYASFAQLGSPAAVLLSMGIFALVTRASGDAFASWGWRIPFLLSFVLLIIGLMIRLGVEESPEFAAAQDRKALSRMPIVDAFRVATKPIVFTLLAFTIGTAGFYFTNTFLIAYSTRTLGLDRGLILECLAMVAVVQFVGQLAAAQIAEKIGDSKFLLAASALAMAAPYPMFTLVETKSQIGIVAGVSIATLCASGFYAVIAGYASKVFPVEVRYTSISAAYQLGGAIFGGFTPIIGVMLSSSYPNVWMPLAIFYSILAGVSFLGVLLLSYTGFAAQYGQASTQPTMPIKAAATN
ncbi:MFS transporter [Bradyrhizobium sp. NP1]|uniref:MFS transporter n=1 Tax=Bradyrhizobium sp. NP1 TaxID=3049772 RepID=UPI0025A51ED0|nr:MFS transporter [Bradyrhizobium sp. NP1]WJR76693.1 MFS transporter [Bradyrhizobium sp. NP1]